MRTAPSDTLCFWRDLNAKPSPLKAPTPSSPNILIIGGGVIGLVTAWVLLDKGYHVTVLAKEWASYGKEQRLTSQISGALWEYPPAVCGQHTDAISLHNSKSWCMVSYHIFDALSVSEELSRNSGVRMRYASFFFACPVEGDETNLSKMREIERSGVRGFRHDSRIIAENSIDPTYGAVDAYEHIAPVIDTDKAMGWLQSLVASKGATFVTRTIHGDLFHQETALRAEYNADVIVNATGFAGTELANDPSCYPIRGGLIRVINDGKSFPKIDHALTISAGTFRTDREEAENGEEIVFIVPRNDNILLLGGFAEKHEHELNLTLDSPVIKRMRKRCEAFIPDLVNAKLDEDYPLAQGLRPFRRQNVRVERELRPRVAVVNGNVVTENSRIVHSYGHGGAGWSLSFGCAADVAKLVEEAMMGLPPKAMEIDESFRKRSNVAIQGSFVARL